MGWRKLRRYPANRSGERLGAPDPERHFQDVLNGSLKLAADEDPNETDA